MSIAVSPSIVKGRQFFQNLMCQIEQDIIADTLPAWRAETFPQSPPVVLLDAICTRVMFHNGRQKRDRKGRLRKITGVKKVPIMVAMAVWPETGQSRILDWEVGCDPGEKAVDWLRLLTRLEERGIRAEKGLKLLISDGGAGLLSALELVHFGAPHQRCIFHKLRNLCRAIIVPEHLSPKGSAATNYGSFTKPESFGKPNAKPRPSSVICSSADGGARNNRQ